MGSAASVPAEKVVDTAKEMLGEKLVKAGGEEVSLEDALLEKKAIGLYFSAHWCGPCKRFTPKLAESYTANLKDKGMEVIFVSWDSDENMFEDYFSEMPWLALPFSERAKKKALVDKYEIRGIPSLVIVDPVDLSAITTSGRSQLYRDPTGESFPWKPERKETIDLAKEMLGEEFIKVGGDEYEHVSIKDALNEKKQIALYFSAHWCGPCKKFTPQLADAYCNHLKDKGMEVIYVSSDSDENMFNEYFAEMPWLALPFNDRARKNKLSKKFSVSGIPTLIILDASDLSLVTERGRSTVWRDPSGEKFPWPSEAKPTPRANMLQEGPEPAILEECDPESHSCAELTGGAWWDGKMLELPDEEAAARPGWDIPANMAQNFVVECTLQLDEWPEHNWQGSIVSQHGSGTGWELRCGGEGVTAVFTTSHGGHNELTAPMTYEKGKWYHLMMAYDAQAQTMTVYVNGEACAPKKIRGSFKPYKGSAVEVGRNPAWNDRGIIGRIYKAMVWPKGTEDVASRASSMLAELQGSKGDECEEN